MSEQPTGGNKSMLVTRIVLFGILGLLIVASAWEWGVARPAVAKSYKELIAMIGQQTSGAASTAFKTPADVQKLVGRAPSGGMKTHTKDGHTFQYEEYIWPAGLPGRSFNLIVVYAGQKSPRPSLVEMNKSIEETLAYAEPGPGEEEHPGGTTAPAAGSSEGGERTSPGSPKEGEPEKGEKSAAKESGEGTSAKAEGETSTGATPSGKADDSSPTPERAGSAETEK